MTPLSTFRTILPSRTGTHLQQLGLPRNHIAVTPETRCFWGGFVQGVNCPDTVLDTVSRSTDWGACLNADLAICSDVVLAAVLSLKTTGYGPIATTLFNPLIATLKPQSNGPSYSNTVIGTLAVDGWAVTVDAAS